MDCNKDEAMRVKELAERKMGEGDFEGARTFALKAQKLYPQLENVVQLLTICDVHRSAQNRIGPGFEKDWYGILQIDRFADESDIKKKYRRMALMLHPDKNRLPGAEAAFQIIAEANAILSDSTKKSLYDCKLRFPTIVKPQPPPHQTNTHFNFNQRTGFGNNVTNGFGNQNQYKATNMFSTICPHCMLKYQVERKLANQSILCPKCIKRFPVYETSAQDVPSSTQPAAFFTPKHVPVTTQPAAQVDPKHVPRFSQPAAQFGPKNVPDPTKPADQVDPKNVPSFSEPAAQVGPKHNPVPTQPAAQFAPKHVPVPTQPADQVDPKHVPSFSQPAAQVGPKHNPVPTEPAAQFAPKHVPVPTQSAAQVPLKPGSGPEDVKRHSASYAGSQENISNIPVPPEPGTRSNCEGIKVANAFGQTSAQVPMKPDSSKVVSGLSQGFSKVGVPNLKEHSASHAGIASVVSGNEDQKANGTSTKYKDGKYEAIDLKRNKKRGRKMVTESKMSFDYSDDSDFETVTDKVNSGQRSSRQKQNIVYNDTNDDDLVPSERLKKQKNLNSENSKVGNQKNFPANENCSKSTKKEKGTTCFEESLQEKHASFDKEGRVGGEINSGRGSGTKSANVKNSDLEFDTDVESYSDLESDSGDDISGKTYECPDTEFYDFEKKRDGAPFKVGQVWACYDDSDSMPRFYAKVTKANSIPFHVSFRWLEEADPTNGAHRNQIVGCGTYKLSKKTENISDRNMFSHEMTSVPGKKRGTLVVHPRKGEMWALFKKSNPENSKEFKYEVVEVESDFADSVGIKVCYMEKINGRVSVFQKAGQIESFMIGPDELYKFSHLVPAYKLVGIDIVPSGSFELDPASLPANPDDLHFPGKGKTESGRMDCPPPKAAAVNVPVKSTRTNNVIDIDSD